MNAVAIRNLTKRFGDVVVFDGLELSVDRGEILAVLGPSGCGKSTLLRCIAGLARPDAGTVGASGEIAFVFQEPRLFPWLTVERNVRFAARNEKEAASAPHLLDRVGLGDAGHLLPKALSGGMAQRAALARALVREPAVLLLDEPLGALDALRRLELQDVLATTIAQARATTILVTHDVDEALRLAHRVVVLRGTPARIVYDSVDADRAGLLDALGVRARVARRATR